MNRGMSSWRNARRWSSTETGTANAGTRIIGRAPIAAAGGALPRPGARSGTSNPDPIPTATTRSSNPSRFHETAIARLPLQLFARANATSGAARIYSTDDGKLLFELPGHKGGVFAVAFRPDGKQVATGGMDGVIRLFDVENGQLVKEFVPVTITSTIAAK